MVQRKEKSAALEELRQQAEAAGRATERAAKLAETGFAFGEGSPDARLMIVGEAPGRREAELGRPFVGAAGSLLDDMLKEAGIRREDVWITNVVKWRPTLKVGDRVANRAPRTDEVAADRQWLQREMEIIRPRIILCLGNLAASTVIHKGFKINEERGKWFDGPLGSRALATFHPAYVLRQHGADRDRLIDLMKQDFRAVREALEEANR